MGKIKKILENELVGGTQSTDVYPITSTKAVYDENNVRLDTILKPATKEAAGLMSPEDKNKLDTVIITEGSSKNSGIPGFLGGTTANKKFINKSGIIKDLSSTPQASNFGYAYLWVKHLRGKSITLNTYSGTENGANCWYDDDNRFISYFQNSKDQVPYDVVVPDNATILGVTFSIRDNDFSAVEKNNILTGRIGIPGFLGGTTNSKKFIDKLGEVVDLSSNHQASNFGYAYLWVKHLRGKSITLNVSPGIENGTNCWYNDDNKLISYFQYSSSQVPYDVVVPDNATVLGVTFKIENNDFSVVEKNNIIDSESYEVLTGFIPEATTKKSGLMSAEDKNKLDSLSSGGTTTENHWKGKKWIAYGTSITNTSNEGKYAKYLEKISGMIRTNRGFSGGGITTASNQTIYNAIVNSDLDGKLDADLITLECYANDGNASLGTIYDITGNDTFAAALNTCIRYLQSKTKAQIVILQSPPGRYQYNNPSIKYNGTETTGPDSHTRNDATELMRKICELNNVYFINWSGLGLYRIKDNNLYVVDQIHHTELGGYIFAKGIWSYLKNIPLFEADIPSIYKV